MNIHGIPWSSMGNTYISLEYITKDYSSPYVNFTWETLCHVSPIWHDEIVDNYTLPI